MPVEPFKIYRDQLRHYYHGFALWRPNPVSIGDVGYISEGAFVRMFNVTLLWNDGSNQAFGEPCHYDPLGNFAIQDETFDKVDYYSRRVIREEDADDTQARSPDQ